MVLFMETSDLKLVKKLAKSLIEVIVSLAVFACGFATIVLHFSKNGIEPNVFDLIYCIAFLPLIGFIVFIVFLFIAKTIVFCSKKAENEKKQSEATNLIIKEAVKSIQKLLEEINKQLSKTNS